METRVNIVWHEIVIIIKMQINIEFVKDHPLLHFLLYQELVRPDLSSMILQLGFWARHLDALIYNINLRTPMQKQQNITEKVNKQSHGTPCKQSQTLLTEITGTSRWAYTQVNVISFTFGPNRMRRPYVLGRVKKTIFFHRDHKIVSIDQNFSETKYLFLLLRLFSLFRADCGSLVTWYEKIKCIVLCWV